jgi:hypothetical protein
VSLGDPADMPVGGVDDAHAKCPRFVISSAIIRGW